jgi:DNA-binding CsgD family transcriptional regulator
MNDRAAEFGAEIVGNLWEGVKMLRKTKLSKRETEVLQWMATGLTYREIGTKLYISRRTAEAHALSACIYLCASNRIAAVRAGVAMGIIKCPYCRDEKIAQEPIVETSPSAELAMLREMVGSATRFNVVTGDIFIQLYESETGWRFISVDGGSDILASVLSSPSGPMTPYKTLADAWPVVLEIRKKADLC